MSERMPQTGRHNNIMRDVAGFEAVWGKPPPYDELGALWQALEAEADGSFFQSWAWVGCCYEQMFTDPALLMVRQSGRVVALGLLNRRIGRLGRQTYYLHQSGDAAWDSVFIEHNGPLYARGVTGVLQAWFLAVRSMQPRGLFGSCRFMFAGIDDAAMDAARAAGRVRILAQRVAPAVNLAALREHDMTILDRVSANTRYQIRRSIRMYAQSGALTLHRASDQQEALAFIDELARLHQRTWQARGKAGAFAPAPFMQFHRQLIARAEPSRQVDVLKVAAGDRVIGYLLNFVYRGHVYAYQSGFDYTVEHPHEKPGLTCHTIAIDHYRAEGRQIYDFLGGEDRYKASFGDFEAKLHWIEGA